MIGKISESALHYVEKGISVSASKYDILSATNVQSHFTKPILFAP